MRSALSIAALFSAGVLLLFAAAGCGSEAPAVVQITPEEAIRQAGERMDAAGSYHMDFDMQMDADGDLSGAESQMAGLLPFSLGFTGQMEIDQSQSDEARFRAYGINIDGLNDLVTRAGEASGADRTQSAMSAGMMTQMTKDLEIVFIGDTMYFRFGGNWFRMAPEDMPEDSGIDLACLFDLQPDQAATPASDIEGLTEITELAQEEANGLPIRHFQARLDPEQLEDNSGTEETEKCLTGPATASDEAEDELSDEEKKAEAEKFSRDLAENTVLEFWVDDQLNLSRMRIVMEMDFADAARAARGDQAAENLKSLVMKMDIEIRYSGFGDAFEITAPVKPFPLKDLLDPFYSAGGGTKPGSRTQT